MNGHDRPLLRVDGLRKRLGAVEALRGVGFGVGRGEIVGLIGPNGAGKTTLMQCVSGLLEADAGFVELEGRRPEFAERKRGLFYLPDAAVPYGDHRVGEALELFAALHGSKDRLEAAVARLGLASERSKAVAALSKGTCKRLLLALALLTPQPLLLLDEPFDGLDLRQTRAAAELLRELRDKGGRSLLMSIHQLSDALRVCERFVLMRAGEVVGSGSLEELRRQAGLAQGGLEEVFLALA
jgi:ABC-2 type transport system ATP-binding protein